MTLTDLNPIRLVCLSNHLFIFLNFYQEDSSIYSYPLFEILNKPSPTSTRWHAFITLYRLYSLYLFCCVINNKVHSVFWFQYSLQLSRGLMWYHYTVCSVYTIHFTAYFVVLWVHSFFLFQYSLQLSRGLMWYHVNPHFCYYVIVFIIKKCYNFFCIF